MTKKEIYDELISIGFVKEGIDGLLKADLQSLLDTHTKTETQNFINTPEPTQELRIISRRPSEYWLEDGTKIPYKDVPHFFSGRRRRPEAKAGEYVKMVDGKWERVF